MRKLTRSLFGAVCVVVYCSAYCQDAPIGQWKDYLSYQQALTVCYGQNQIFCAGASGLFSYNLGDNSIERYNKTTGLSDIGITVARFNSSVNALLIGYSDGNMDIIQNRQIVNIPDLKNAVIEGNKTINNISFYSNLAYVSFGEGIMVVDMNQDIILANYIIGPGGTALGVYNVAIYNDTIFAATAMGVYKIAINDPNPQNYADWVQVKKPLPYGKGVIFNAITVCGGKLYASYSNQLSKNIYKSDTIYTYYNGQWSYFTPEVGANIKIDTNGTDDVYAMETGYANNAYYFQYCGLYGVYIFDTNGNRVNLIDNYSFNNTVKANDIYMDNQMNYWVADNFFGMVYVTPNSSQSIIPSGPFSNQVFSLSVAGNSLWFTRGGYTDAPDFNPPVVSQFYDGIWYQVSPEPSLGITDICCCAIDPNNPRHAFCGSWDYGVVEYLNDQVVRIYNQNNGIPTTYRSNGTLCRIAGMAFDSLGNLWITNDLAFSQYLAVKKASDTNFTAFDFSAFTQIPQGSSAVQILVTQSQAKWILVPGYGILVYQDNGTFAQPNSSNTIVINGATHNGALPSLNVYSIAQDINGSIWVGNDVQIAVFSNPANVLDNQGDWDSQPVYVTQTGYTQYLMQNQTVVSLAIDGANRKWIGTLGGGTFLMSPDGTQQIYNFTSSNSPLFSNNVLNLGIDQTNGDVFFGTDQGVVSFRGTATQGASAFGSVYSFPDPVPHGYDGPIAITGLANNADVKIATVTGELVYHTVALGGQAIWYGNNFNGERVQTGVYLIFCASPDGTQTAVSKLLFIN
jgi:hypothetical protein